MELRKFHNALRVLLNIEYHELLQAGVLTQPDNGQWDRFSRDPFRFFIRADDDTAAKLWAIIESRQSMRSAA